MMMTQNEVFDVLERFHELIIERQNVIYAMLGEPFKVKIQLTNQIRVQTVVDVKFFH
jgi:hypothetical protein